MKVILSPEAVADLDEIHAYIFQFNPDSADRFLDKTLAVLRRLSRAPRLGRVRKFNNPLLSDLRSFRIDRFRNYVVFYRVAAERVEVVRVLHGARDLDALFGND